jgi:hypothetical protein
VEKGTGLVDVGVPSLNIQRNGNSQSQRKYLVSQLYVWFQLTLLFRESCDGGQLSSTNKNELRSTESNQPR